MEQKTFQHLLEQVSSINKKYEEIARLTGENFNVFKILGVHTEEVRTHSAFLCELLNPKGSHGCRNIFLELFLSEVKDALDKNENKKFLERLDKFEIDEYSVETESHIGFISEDEKEGGRIDILLKDIKNNAIIIENKIHAGDQKNQLFRYKNAYKEAPIFYLTLYGTDPSDDSTNSGAIKKGEDFVCISYKDEIKNWLEACQKEAVDKPIIRETIKQYIYLIKSLTGQTNNKIMAEEITDYISKNSENLKTAILISKNLKEVKVKIQNLFWQSIKAEFEKKGRYLKCLRDNSEYETIPLSTIKDFYFKTKNKQNYGLEYEIFSSNTISVHYKMVINDKIYYGFIIRENGISGISKRREFEKILSFLKKIDANYINNAWWLGYKLSNPILDFKAFNSDVIYNFVNEDYLNEIVSKIVEDSIKDIDELLKNMNDLLK